MVLGGFGGFCCLLWVLLGRFGWFRVLVLTQGVTQGDNSEIQNDVFRQERRQGTRNLEKEANAL